MTIPAHATSPLYLYFAPTVVGPASTTIHLTAPACTFDLPVTGYGYELDGGRPVADAAPTDARDDAPTDARDATPTDAGTPDAAGTADAPTPDAGTTIVDAAPRPVDAPRADTPIADAASSDAVIHVPPRLGSSGCGCATAGTSADLPTFLLAAGTLAVLLARRRRGRAAG